KLSSPIGVAVAADGTLYIADYNNHRIRKVSPSGTISTVVGTGRADFGGDGDLATKAYLYYPGDVAIDSQGNLLIADGSNRIRRVSAAGVITTIAGNGSRSAIGDGGSALAAGLNPNQIMTTADGTILVADYANARVRKITPGGTISTIAGTGV